jgi:hypothetical protein
MYYQKCIHWIMYYYTVADWNKYYHLLRTGICTTAIYWIMT